MKKESNSDEKNILKSETNEDMIDWWVGTVILIRLIAHLSSDGSRSSFQRSSVICLNSQLLRSCTKKLSGAVHRSFPEDHFQEKN